MHVVPVIDLQGGLAVTGCAGDRARYRPVVSRLATAGGEAVRLADPATLASAYVRALSPAWIYAADLDRIGRRGDNDAALAAIHAAAPAARLLWDGGPGGPPVPALERLRPILASESIVDPRSLGPRGAFWIGLDLAPGGLLAAPTVAAAGEQALLDAARAAGCGGAVVVATHHVGTGAGLPLDRLRRLRQAARGLPMFAGGGVAGLDDLVALRDLGYDGALVATALHDGSLRPADLRRAGFD